MLRPELPWLGVVQGRRACCHGDNRRDLVARENRLRGSGLDRPGEPRSGLIVLPRDTAQDKQAALVRHDLASLPVALRLPAGALIGDGTHRHHLPAGSPTLVPRAVLDVMAPPGSLDSD